MGDDDEGVVHSGSEGGVSGSHPPADEVPLVVAPSTANESNALLLWKNPVACWKVEDIRFAFGSSFVTPDIAKEIRELFDLRARHRKTDLATGITRYPPLSVFGHADPVGPPADPDGFNKALSGRRAKVIYALLLSNTEPDFAFSLWQAVASDPNEQWGADQRRTMLTATGLPHGTPDRDLYKAYMKSLCPPNMNLHKQDFLGQGADPQGKGDYQGCSSFNPVVVFSQQKENKFAQAVQNNNQAGIAARNAANAPNRRVVILLFMVGSKVDPAKWRCPRALDPKTVCLSRFFADGQHRRTDHLPDTDRKFTTTKKTFACRFYQRISDCSLCESVGPTFWPISIKGKLFWNRTWDYNDEKTPIGPVKEYLPGARVELRIEVEGQPSPITQGSTFLTDDGEFRFDGVPECTSAALRVFLEYRNNKVVCVKGKSNAVSDPDFEVKKGAIVWHQFDLNMSYVNGMVTPVDLGDVEINRTHFVDICDAYKSVWFGHKRLNDLVSYDLPICQINYPEPPTGISNASEQMSLLKLDLKDRDVILHEYGHFIGNDILGGLENPGYGYNDDVKEKHGRDTKEHYEAAWIEGHATFLSCALCDDPHYHDGYDAHVDYHLDTDNTTLGPHSEGSIQEALWRIYKVHNISFKDGFWKAFSDHSKRKVCTIFDFWQNWKDLGIADLDKVLEAYKKFNMEYGYRYLDGGDRFTAVAAPKGFDKAAKEFRTVDELFAQFGTLGGGTLSDYKEEFYNRNKQFNPSSLRAGSTLSAFNVVAGKTYIVPERFQVTT